MSKRKQSLIVTAVMAIGGAIISGEKLLTRLLTWLTAPGDVQEHVAPHVVPLLRRLVEPMPALDYAAWVLVGGGIATLVLINYEQIKRLWRSIGLVADGKEPRYRLGFVFRVYRPFADNKIFIPQKGKTNFYHHYVGVRNLDDEKTIRRVRVQVIDIGQAASEIPMTMCSKDWNSSFPLSPNEMRLIAFTQQEVRQHDDTRYQPKWGWVYIVGANGTRVSFSPKGRYIVRLAAYGDDAYGTAEFTFEFDEDSRLRIRPVVMGDHPESDDVHGFGEMTMGPSEPIPPS